MVSPGSPARAPGRVLAGRYRLERKVAQGAMAEVWEAEDEVLARPVAVKILHVHLAEDERVRERFRREAIAAASLAHPHVVATFDTGTDEGVSFIVMELVAGRSLRDLLREQPSMAPGRACEIAVQVAAALDHAHRAGIVHRDIKPANILLSDDRAHHLRVKVADFGIARATAGGQELTETGAVVGTAAYLSPEQAEGREPDARSDVYALGVVLYEMLAGAPPFWADTELATAVQHIQQAPVPLRTRRPDVPPGLADVTARALAKDPDQRFPTAEAMRLALVAVQQQLDDAEPMVERSPTPPVGSPAAASRRRVRVPALIAAGAVVTGVAVAALLAARGGDDPADGPGSAPVPVAAVRPFDPQGDGRENDAEAPLVLDGRPDTTWTSERYDSRPFGGLKDGVGLVLQLDGSRRLGRLEVSSPAQGWAAQVHVAGAPQGELDAWGEPVASLGNAPGDAVFDLGGREAGAVLVWFTDPGPARRVEVSGIVLRP